MGESPAISIITPTFNRCIPLLRAIFSVQSQGFENYEHIIVDDASSDDTLEAVGAINDQRIRVLPLGEWRGANYARNAGVAMSRAPLVTFLDSDDEYLPHRLSTTIEFFARTPARNLLISSFETHKENGVSRNENPAIDVARELWEKAILAHAVHIAGSAISIRRDFLDQVEGFDPDLKRMQDRDLLLRLARLEGASLCPVINWVKHRSIDSISAPREDYLRALAALLEKHGTIIQNRRKVVGYLVARTLLADLFQGNWRYLHAGMRENREIELFRFSLPQLLTGYFSGKTYRKNILKELHSTQEAP